MIRDATPADAPALAALKLATFRTTFLDEFAIPYPPADLAVFEEASYGLAKVTAELADLTHKTWVVEGPDGRLDAYCHLGPCKLPHADVAEGDMEIYQLYLRREAQGRGLGKALLDLALEFLGSARPVWIGVWSGNDRARHVYAQKGFVEVGAYEFPVGEWRDAEVIMRRDVA